MLVNAALACELVGRGGDVRESQQRPSGLVL